MELVRDRTPILKLALRYHREGNRGYATCIYPHILHIDSQNADALHLLGAISYQSKQYGIIVN